MMDGAGYWRRVRRIILPLTRRVLLLTTLVSAIGSMLAFDQFYIMTSGGPRGQTFTAVYWIYQNSFVSFKLGYGSALSVVLTLIILVFSALQIALTVRSERDMSAAALTSRGQRRSPRRTAAASAPAPVSRSPPASRSWRSWPRRWCSLSSPRSRRRPKPRPSPPHYLPHAFSLENYVKVVDYQAGLATYVGNSALVALMTIAACIALAAPAGYGLARFSLRGKEIAFLVLLAPMMIPYQALLTPLYLDFAKVGLVNTHARPGDRAHDPAAAVLGLSSCATASRRSRARSRRRR